jgi:hypothetical protein
MAYTQELINEVKELYPNSPEMHKLAESGGAFLGRYLDDNCQGGISVNEILLATSLDELQKKARLLKRKKELYAKWCDQDPRPKMY